MDNATPRNAPCPCGSGKRYKECHGAFGPTRAAPSHLDRLAEAKLAIKDNDFGKARASCEAVLREATDHPFALDLLAQIDVASGNLGGALRLLLRAVRALPRHQLPVQIVYDVWTTLNSTFKLALWRNDAASRAVRERYNRWQATRSAPQFRRAVAVVLVLGPSTSAEAASATLQSLVAQTLRPAELVVCVIADSPAASVVRAIASTLPFAARILDEPASTAAEAWNRAVRAAQSAWIAIVEPPSRFTPSHLASLVDLADGKGARFAWSGAAPLRTAGMSDQAHSAESARMDAAQTSAVKADSLGLSMVAQWSPLPGVGALLFERALHESLGGFRPLREHEAWDFCLRACWESEPVRSVDATYEHAAVQGNPMTPVERESIQLAMFREFHARALSNESAHNAFAPSLAVWGTRYMRRLFEVGHVLMVGEDALTRFVERIEAMEKDTGPQLTPGVNLIGFAYGEFGLGESMRALARACETGGVSFVVKDVEQHLATRQADASIAAHIGDELRHTVSLMCVNPDVLRPVRPLLERTRASGGIAIGYWYWELETIPRDWEPAFDAVDEVWCATQFVADAMARTTHKPVVRIPPPLEIAAPRGYGRRHFALPEGRFLFLFTFDYNSFVKRKNPEAVIAAFREAFPRSRDDVGLIVKSVNGVNQPQRYAAMLEHAGGDPRILPIDRFLSREESYALILATDAYVSLHRSEGLGLGLCEAMALGRPTIATAYSGNLEFMNESNSLLVDYRLVPLARGDYLVDDERFVWAEPDVAAAARSMRRLADDAALRERLAAAGQAEIRTRFTRERTAALIRERLAHLGVLAA